MNQIETENAAALAEIYGTDLVDAATGKQAESVQIDGRGILGNLDFDPSSVEIVFGGTNENVTAAFYTLKQYWPDGKFPRALSSELTCVVNGQERHYQVTKLQGDKDNRAQLAIGLGAFTNRKG